MTAMNPYHTRGTEGASAVEITIALYGGIIRFMYRAIEAVERGEVEQRRAAVKRAMDIVIHLQATLKMDVGGAPAEALAEFYASMFALMLQGSRADSKQKFERVIACVHNVRTAWKQVARDPNVMGANTGADWQAANESSGIVAGSGAGSSWMT